MELPDDVLAIVRAYSKPVFEHYQAYNHALKVLGKKQWTKLKEKLQEEPHIVIPALNEYLEALLRKREAYRLRDQMKEILVSDVANRWIVQNQYHNYAYNSKRREEDLFWQFIRLLYGDGQAYWDFTENME